MTYKQINGAREVRLWVGQIIIPSVVLTTTILNNPEACKAIKNKCKKVKESVENKFHKN